MADLGQSLSQVRNIFTLVLLLFGEFKCCPAYASPLSSTAKMNLTKTEYRKKDPNRSWEVKVDSHVFLICIGRAEIKRFGWCTDR